MIANMMMIMGKKNPNLFSFYFRSFILDSLDAFMLDLTEIGEEVPLMLHVFWLCLQRSEGGGSELAQAQSCGDGT